MLTFLTFFGPKPLRWGSLHHLPYRVFELCKSLKSKRNFPFFLSIRKPDKKRAKCAGLRGYFVAVSEVETFVQNEMRSRFSFLMHCLTVWLKAKLFT